MEGVVADWNSAKGYGFINFSDGRRAYVHKSAVTTGNLQKGEAVVGELVADEKNPGKWAAQNVAPCGAAGGALNDLLDTWTPSVAPSTVSGADAAAADAVAQLLANYSAPSDGERLEGVVTDWRPQQGFGFVQVADGRRAYVHRATCGGGDLSLGETVIVTIVPDSRTPGKWATSQVERSTQSEELASHLSTPQVPVPPPPVSQLPPDPPAEDPLSSLVSLVTGGLGGGVAAAAVPAAPSTASTGELGEDRRQASVTEWRTQGYGFVQVEDGRRAYVHKSSCGGEHLQDGETISCMVVPDARNPGKWEAKSVLRAAQEGVEEATNALVDALATALEPGLAALMSGGGAAGTTLTLPAAGDGRLEGICTDWKDSGYGFIQVADGRRAYVHRSMCVDGQHLQVGEAVLAHIVPDSANPGKWAANDVERTALTASSYATIAAMQAEQPKPHDNIPGPNDERLEGIVTEWKGAGYGFIQVSDGRRAYVHKTAAGGAPLQEGETVTCCIVADTQNPGKWAAQHVARGGLGSPADLAAAATQQVAAAVTGDLPQQLLDAVASLVPGGLEGLASSASAPLALGDGNQLQEGVVTQWSSDRGFGFIQFNDGRRAYLNRDGAPGLEPETGLPIRGDVVEDATSPGKWMAVNVQRVDAPVPESALQQSLVDAVSNLLAGSPAQASSAGDVLASLGLTAEGGEDAVVSEWHEASGYGFLLLDDGRRAYIHRSMLGQLPGQGGLVVGSRIRITVKPDPRNEGKWTVDQVIGTPLEAVASAAAIGGVAAAPAPFLGATGHGTVSTWNEDGGYGFLTMDDGKRAYIHRSMFGGSGSLTVGSTLYVSTRPDSRNPGKICVSEVLAGEIINAGLEPPQKRSRSF